jgi:TRAP-type C4-dicarboxylate transport system permease small subunit
VIRLLQRSAGFLTAVSAGLNRICLLAACWLLTAMLLTVGLQVLARYVFFSPPSWTEELARYLMIWAGLLGATVAFYRREDPVLMVPPRIRSATISLLAAAVRAAAVMLFLLPLVYYSPQILEHHMLRLTDSTQINLAYIFVIVPVFAAIILFHLLARLFTRILAFFTTRER